MPRSDREAYSELMLYTLAHRDPAFIHQHVVDAYAAQHASENTKPMTTAFALAGLYLHPEKGFSGKQVQQAHMRMARHRKEWPQLEAPEPAGGVTVHDVLDAPAGAERDRMIRAWCVSVWDAWKGSRQRVVGLVQRELFGN